MQHNQNSHSCNIESMFRMQKFDIDHLPTLESFQKNISNCAFKKLPSVTLSLNSSNTLKSFKTIKAFSNSECSTITQDQRPFLSRNHHKKHNTSSLDLSQIDYSSKPITKIFEFVPKIKAKQKLKPLCKDSHKCLQNKTKYEIDIDINLKNLKIKKYHTVKAQDKMNMHNKESKTKNSLGNANYNRNIQLKLDEENLPENMLLNKKLKKKREKDCKNIVFDKISAISAWEINSPDFCYDNNWEVNNFI
ncbi:hypothetical protein SteCoe_6876 [Stentor coeruleus]|uniref:Uncharacterized protein n=1 Tax=Stentor coeruleus TaxID=5963 RepID=A0A1R2CNZ2_9CILI|nr:hypothetical protein SteCoe_6876 [Stentor coeruleus]